MSAPQLCEAATARAVARRFGVSPSRRLGQNFLVDRGVRDAILDVIGAPRLVVEIGAGLGALTQGLLERGTAVLAVELDPACGAALGLLRRHHPGLRVLQGDVLRLLPELAREGADKVVGNLPYQLTGALLPRLLAWPPAPPPCHLVLQREVAHRLAAAPGDWSLATLAVRALASVRVEFDIAPASFWPAPRVHSSLVSLGALAGERPAEAEAVLALARGVFAARRKQLRNGLAGALGRGPDEAAAILRQAEIDPSRRPGTLEPEEWSRLLRACPGGAAPTR